MISGWVDCRQCADEFEAVAFGTSGDEGVEPVLRSQCVGQVWSPAGEAGNPPLIGIGGVRGVPRLVGSVEVAKADVQDPDWRRRRHIREGAR
jgi:hypothetical protein